MRIVTVLNTKRRQGIAGQEFSPRHVYALQDQIRKWAPFAEFICLSDVPMSSVTRIPLQHDWPGWWAKMEMFSRAIDGDFLYLDLDTVVRGPLDEVLAVRELTLLRDFYRPKGLGSGVMFLPESVREEVWHYWVKQPQLRMREYSLGGDQALLEKFWLNIARRWQDVLPGQIVSYKVDCKNGVPPDANVIAFHGKPRPWTVGQFLPLYR